MKNFSNVFSERNPSREIKQIIEFNNFRRILCTYDQIFLHSKYIYLLLEEHSL